MTCRTPNDGQILLASALTSGSIQVKKTEQSKSDDQAVREKGPRRRCCYSSVCSEARAVPYFETLRRSNEKTAPNET